MWVASISSYANGDETVECPAKTTQFLSRISLKMQLKTLWIDMKLNKLHSYMIPCDKFNPQEYLGSLQKLTNQIWCKTSKNPLNEKKITHAM